MPEPLSTPLAFINEQCRVELERPEPRIIQRIRIHPSDRPVLYDELRRTGTPPLGGTDNGLAAPIWGIPVIDDERCTDGPVVEWREDNLAEVMEVMERLLGRA